MKTVYIKPEEINSLNAETVCVCITLNNDIVCVDGIDIMNSTGKSIMSEALEAYLNDISGNSFEIIAALQYSQYQKELVKISFKQ